MQKVSKEYAKSMKKPIRDRGFIRVSFGVINHKAQENASVGSGSFTYFTNNERIFDSQIRKEQYATFEENFTKLDGTMYFLPREDSGLGYYDTGLIASPLVSDGTVEVMINLNIPATEIKGLTIDFGENYPTSFDIVHGGGTISVINNTNSKWETQEVIGPTNYFRILVYSMKNPKSRLRISSILFGYGLVYDNEQVMDSELSSYVSPIGQDVPQIDFYVILNNYDHYFNVDEPSSAINYLETGQNIDVMYGYEIVGEEGQEPRIEWVKGGALKCSGWESTDTTATIRGQDIFRSMDSEYYKGKYYENGISFYDLALDVLRDSGETGFYLDPRLKTLYTKNPLPRVRHKEALQIIANACRCILFQTRDGGISIKSNFKPGIEFSSDGETSYSDVTSLYEHPNKKEYASFSTDYSKVNGTMYFLPRSGAREIETGYISSAQSNGNKEFSTNPVITLIQDALCSYYTLRIVFGSSLPEEFVIRTYNYSTLAETISFPNDEYEISKDMQIIHKFEDFNKMEIEFTKTENPNSRITVNYISFDDTANFTMGLDDMISPPIAIKQERIQEVVVPCYLYQTTQEQVVLVSQQIDTLGGETIKFFFSDPCYGYTVTIDGNNSGAEIIGSGCYYAEAEISVSGAHTIEILGYKYNIVQVDTTEKIYQSGQDGVTKRWANPLISDLGQAKDLALWLANYYKTVVEYEYSTRGYPELDVNDTIHQERKTKSGVKIVDVNVYRHTIKFRQAFSGKIVARRQEEE